MTRDDKIIIAGYRHAKGDGWPGECPYETEADRLLWLEGFTSYHIEPKRNAETPMQALSRLRERAITTLFEITGTPNDNTLETIP